MQNCMLSLIWTILLKKTRHNNIGDQQKPVMHDALARLGSGQGTTKGGQTAGDQLITFSGFGTTVKNLGGGSGPL
jgi:hypothetical protein